MRIVLAIAIWALCVGGVRLYLAHRDENRPAAPPAFERREAPGAYALELTTTFGWRPQSAEPDPFSLSGEPEAPTPPLRVQLDGREILAWTRELKPGEPVRAADIQGVKTGKNEFFIRALPQGEHAGARHAVRVRLFRDERPLADRTFWTEGALGLAETVSIEVEPEPRAPGEAEHAH
ncbi:MAG: hypothetical protein M5U26_05870 [Planctomycetota bacterium]|nr:hypothetical protein [Planctomycetota bacterium]